MKKHVRRSCTAGRSLANPTFAGKKFHCCGMTSQKTHAKRVFCRKVTAEMQKAERASSKRTASYRRNLHRHAEAAANVNKGLFGLSHRRHSRR